MKIAIAYNKPDKNKPDSGFIAALKKEGIKKEYFIDSLIKNSIRKK